MKELTAYIIVATNKFQTHILAGYTDKNEALRVLGELALNNNDQLFYNKTKYSLDEIVVKS